MKEKFDRIREICGGWGLYEHGASTEQAQLLKALSEVGELADSILKNDREQARDDIGDILVCLVNAFEIVNSRLLGGEVFERHFRQRLHSINGVNMGICRLIDEISCGIKFGYFSPQGCFAAINALLDHFSLTLKECLDQAISVIEKRKGRIIGGVFIKDEK